MESSDNSSFGSSCLESSKLHVCVCIVWRWTTHVYHTIKSTLDLLSHVYHMLTSIWSRLSDIQSLVISTVVNDVCMVGISHLYFTLLYSVLFTKISPFPPLSLLLFLFTSFSLFLYTPLSHSPLLPLLFHSAISQGEHGEESCN